MINDLIDQLKGLKFFNKISLKWGYHQVLIEETNVWKTNLKSKEGIFEWLAIPFGWNNALSMFMIIMDDIL